MFKEFKEFISRGNVIDLAVGVIIGGAFGKIVTSIVDDILMPLIGMAMGGVNFTNLSVQIGDAQVKYGNFIQNVIDFLIVAFCIFLIIKLIARAGKRMERLAKKAKKKAMKKGEKIEEEEPVEEIVPKSDEVVLLEEIRDLLKNK